MVIALASYKSPHYGKEAYDDEGVLTIGSETYSVFIHNHMESASKFSSMLYSAKARVTHKEE